MRRSFSRRSFLALGGVAVMSVGLTMAGYSPMQGEPTVQVQSSDFSSQPEERDLMGSADPCDVRVGLIMGPPSMGLSQFMLAVQNGKTENNFEFTVDGVDYISLSASLNQGDFDIATLPSNIGPILYNNKELQNSYQVISVNNLGVLYVMTTVSSISAFSDLAGRRVYGYGEGGTPEYTVEALLKKTGMEDSFMLEFKATPFEVPNLMQQEENCVAILPQPFVSLSKLMVEPLYVPVSITAEWNKAFADTGSQAITTTTIVNRAFLEEHEQAVVEYLQMSGMSVEWTLENMDKAAALQEELGTFMNNSVAADAMPQIALTCLTGTEMRAALSGFIDELYAANPDLVGGAIPGEDFYYLPFTGTIDDDAIGKEQAQAAVQQ